jgi:hypothetical protein
MCRLEKQDLIVSHARALQATLAARPKKPTSMSLPSSPAIVSFSSRPEVSLSSSVFAPGTTSVRFSAVNHADTQQKQEQRTAAKKEAGGDEWEKAQLQSGVGPRGPRDPRSRGSSSLGVGYQDDDWRAEVQRQEHYQVCLYIYMCAHAPVHL